MASNLEAVIAANDAEIAELRDRLQQRQRQQRDELERLLLQQQPQHDEIPQQQQDEIQQQQQHNQQLENQQDENQQRHQHGDTTSTTSSISPVVSAAVAAPTWTLKAGVPVLIGAAPSAAAPSAAPSAEAEAEAEGDSADEAYEATKHMPNKWRVRHDMLETAVLQQEHKRARKLARRMYAGPPMGYI